MEAKLLGKHNLGQRLNKRKFHVQVMVSLKDTVSFHSNSFSLFELSRIDENVLEVSHLCRQNIFSVTLSP